MNRFNVPFCRETYKGLSLKEKILAIFYFPTFLIIWYGYYMWKVKKPEHSPTTPTQENAYPSSANIEKAKQ